MQSAQNIPLSILTDGHWTGGTEEDWLVLEPAPTSATIEIRLNSRSRICAVRVDWVQVGAWRLDLVDGDLPPVPVHHGAAAAGLRDGAGGRRAAAAWFGCRQATAALLQLLRPADVTSAVTPNATKRQYMYGLCT